jgi:transcriptional regulator with XRE-family HTH domain
MNKIKELRLLKEKTQAQIANALGIAQQTYARYELDGIMPPVEMLKKIADYFNVSIDYILGIENEKIQKKESSIEQQVAPLYLRLAKGAQEIGLDKEDIDYLLDFYKRAKKKNEK